MEASINFITDLIINYMSFWFADAKNIFVLFEIEIIQEFYSIVRIWTKIAHNAEQLLR